jgi:hypothetical protein
LPPRSRDVREHVLQEMRQEIRSLARQGMSAKQIDEHVNGHRNLTEAEQELVYLVTYHAVADVKGRY